MKNRIRDIRKSLNLTMEKFGDRLGVTKVAISLIESGKNNITDQMIKAICREFNVNEESFRTGINWPEHMFNELPEEDAIASIVYDLLKDKENPFYQTIVSILKTYNQLTPENKAVLCSYSTKLLDNLPSKKDA